MFGKVRCLVAPAVQSYLKRRRLAIVLAVASVLFLTAGIVFDLPIETSFRPSISDKTDGITIVHGAAEFGAEEVNHSYFLQLDSDYRVESRTLLQGMCLAIVEGQLVFEHRVANLDDPGLDLDQEWPIHDAIPGPEPGSIWVVGEREEAKEIVFRRIIGNEAGQEELVGRPEGTVKRIHAFRLEDGTPAVAWLERETSIVRVTVWNGWRFEPFEEFELDHSWYFTPVAAKGRLLLVYHHRSDRSLTSLILRVTCCKACGKNAPPRLEIDDPVWLGRSITGLDTLRTGTGHLLAITRTTSLQLLPLTEDARMAGGLISVDSQPFLRKIASYLWPGTMLFLSFSLVFLGFTLMRERRRILMEHLGPYLQDAPPYYADTMQRAMAAILDLVLLVPAWMLISEVIGSVPEEPEFSITDPGWYTILGIWFAMLFVYGFVQEWLWGRTLGKLLVGIKVERTDGKPVTFLNALVRNLLRLVDANVFLTIFLLGGWIYIPVAILPAIGFAFLLISRKRQRPGDFLARTVVLDLTRPDEPPNKGLTEAFKKAVEEARKKKRGD